MERSEAIDRKVHIISEIKMDIVIVVVIFVIIALLFDYSNGLNDAANALATTVSTRALSPSKTLILGVICEFLGAVIVVYLTLWLGRIPFFKTVADTMGKIVALPTVGDTLSTGVFSIEWLGIIMCIGLLGAMMWNIVTWYFGIPVSASHALIGGMCGSAYAALGTGAIKVGVVITSVSALIISPLIAIPTAYLLMKLILYGVRHSTPDIKERFRKGVIISSAAFAFSHGANDGQKTMGIITVFLISAGLWNLSPHGTIDPPLWVVIACAVAIALGVATGGFRVMKTVGMKIFKLRYEHGFNAQAVSTAIILGNSFIGFPVSTTHVITTSVMGTGSAKRISAVKWGIGKKIIITWIITIPACFIFTVLLYFMVALLLGFPISFY